MTDAMYCCEDCLELEGADPPPSWVAGTLHCSHAGRPVTFHPPHVWTYTREDGGKSYFNCPGQGEPAVTASQTDRQPDAPLSTDSAPYRAVWECCGQEYDERAVAIHDHCTRCHRMYSQGWEVCPHCEPDPSLSAPTAPQGTPDLAASAPDRAADVAGTTPGQHGTRSPA